MANKIYPGNWLCIMDLSNTQQYYAKFFRLVQWLEEISVGKHKDCYAHDEILPFYISRKDNSKICNANELQKQESQYANKNSKKYNKITSKEQLLLGLDREKTQYKGMVQSNHFSYYIRIHLNSNAGDIIELQYFVLVLQMLPSIRYRIAVRIMENEENKWDESDFFRVSDFLQFIQKKYHCFFACYNKNISSLRLLRQEAHGTQTSFLPMLEIDAHLYGALNKTWFLTYNTTNNSTFDKLFNEIYPENCEENGLIKSLFSIGLRLFFKSLPGRRYSRKEKKQKLLKFLVDLVRDVQGITPLDMLLFGALAGDKLQNGIDSITAKECMGEVQMLSLAISQILENIVNHSEHNRGVFTFRIQSHREYLDMHYPDYKCNADKGALEILIADGNQLDGIVEHFLNSNKADVRLRNKSDDICLGQLLGDCKDEKIANIWHDVRKDRPEMCHGLLAFAHSIRKLNGAFWVRSAPEIESKSDRNLYYFNNTKNSYETGKLLFGLYIPGTQYSIVINRNEKSFGSVTGDQDWAFDFDKLVYSTTCQDLAKVLMYEKNITEMVLKTEMLESVQNPKNQAEKDAASLWWKDWFDSYAVQKDSSKYIVFQYNLEILCKSLVENPELGEPFCKGFLSSHFFIASPKEPQKKSKKDGYCCILFQNANAQFSRIFATAIRAAEVQGIAKWEKTGVYFVMRRYNGSNLSYSTAVMQDLLDYYDKNIFEEKFPRIFPEPLFVKSGETDSQFEQELLRQANTSITDKNSQGFKIEDTHMRLGNKVHIDKFYEMALFFENPNYAYYTAFLFLRTFLTEYSELLCSKRQLLFYGYASYSRAIIWSAIQMLNYNIKTDYRSKEEQDKIQDLKIGFVIYQNDLKLDSEEPQIQMYYSQEKWQREPHEIWDPQNTTLISIVPISSSLTTFSKMIKELNRETGKNFVSELNYTAFWVRNEFPPDEICEHTKEEEGFWEEVNPKTKTISRSSVNGNIQYLAYVTSKWRDPLGCKKCFPEDPIFEYPLVETDPTSTVPTQQFYLVKEQKITENKSDKDAQEQKNDERIANLKGNMLYGHVSKGENHYQYFIKNQLYFQKEKERIISWLRGLRQEAIDNGSYAVTNRDCINVLVIPQKADNVEFSQYVYEYYFQGCAECVVVNTEKEFRSNFKAAYSGLFDRLRTTAVSNDNVRFHYIDTSLQTGSSFNRAISLLSACVEDWGYNEEMQKEGGRYEFRIEQVFLLISRLSESSKRQYVKYPDQDFHAYAQLAISSMRTFGDSCVPCKLQQEAQRYYKKAATKSISSYWEKKIYERACVPFDQVEMNENEDIVKHEEGYMRMVCSHRAAHYIRPIQGATVLSYFLALREFFDEICNANSNNTVNSCIYREINAKNRKDWLAASLKVIARPFFAYDYKTRCAVMDMYLLLAEFWIGESGVEELKKRLKKNDSGEKGYLLEENNLNWIEDFFKNIITAIGDDECERLEFIRNNILKSLADIKSNYILRKATLLRLSNKISIACPINGTSEKASEFYQHYLRSILRMTHSSSDETKSLWLEYLLQFGEEYKKDDGRDLSKKDSNGISQLVNEVPQNIQNVFQNFLEVLLIENNRPIYQLVMEFYKKDKGEETTNFFTNETEISTQEERKFLVEYATRKSAKFLQFGKYNSVNQYCLHALNQMLMLLNRTSHEINRYNDLGKTLQHIVKTETEPKGSVVLFGESEQINKQGCSPITKYLNLPDYFELFPQYFNEQSTRGKTEEQIKFEKEWNKIKKNEIDLEFLNKNSFLLLPQEMEKVNIVIKLDNNYEEIIPLQKKVHDVEIQKIDPIYIYIPCSVCRQQALGLVRKILMFRKKLIEWLETDFNNNAIAVLSRQQYLAKVLSTDKMGDHNDDDFVECQEMLLMATDLNEFNEENRMGNWENSVGEDGMPINIYEVPEDAKPPLCDKLGDTREWFFLRSYVNSRISRLFRTMVRTENELSRGERINVEEYYARDAQSVTMRPVRDLSTVFFAPIKIGYTRKNYLRQMMDVVTFTINEIPDYKIEEKIKPEADISLRLQNVENLLKTFTCISLFVEKKNLDCAYLAEYLTAILLDCFISGVKAGEVWNKAKWGGEAFKTLQDKKANEKCEIELFREHGKTTCGEIRYDYLVIRNKIHKPLRSKKKGFGMSQAAIKWYIESLWQEYVGEGMTYPEVYTGESNDQYTIKLPILEWKENNQ